MKVSIKPSLQLLHFGRVTMTNCINYIQYNLQLPSVQDRPTGNNAATVWFYICNKKIYSKCRKQAVFKIIDSPSQR